MKPNETYTSHEIGNIPPQFPFFYFGDCSNDEYHVKTAKTVEEGCELAKVGFAYLTTIDDVQIFRKRNRN